MAALSSVPFSCFFFLWFPFVCFLPPSFFHPSSAPIVSPVARSFLLRCCGRTPVFSPSCLRLCFFVQVLASFFAALGLLFIAANKLYQGKNILPHTVHSVLGTIVSASRHFLGVAATCQTCQGCTRRTDHDVPDRDGACQWAGTCVLMMRSVQVTWKHLPIIQFVTDQRTRW